MFFLYHLRFGVLTYGFALAYSVTVETKKLIEAMIRTKLAEWVESIKPLLECPKWRGTIELSLDVDMEKQDVKIKNRIIPT